MSGNKRTIVNAGRMKRVNSRALSLTYNSHRSRLSASYEQEGRGTKSERWRRFSGKEMGGKRKIAVGQSVVKTKSSEWEDVPPPRLSQLYQK